MKERDLHKPKGKDEMQTPGYAINPLIPYLKIMESKKPRLSDGRVNFCVWEPAAGQGNLWDALRSAGFQATGGDIVSPRFHRHDFLKGDYKRYDFDCIVTNPPFSTKDEWLAKCYEIGKPFALLLPLTCLEGQKRQPLYVKYGIQLIVPFRRYPFYFPNGDKYSHYKMCAWFTWGFNLPLQLNWYGIGEPPEKELNQ